MTKKRAGQQKGGVLSHEALRKNSDVNVRLTVPPVGIHDGPREPWKVGRSETTLEASSMLEIYALNN
jgi:hypothetical protein